jgi:Tfp pilus assembly protein PilP
MAMKLTLGILATAMMVSGAWAQSPDAIDNARSTAKSLQQKQDNAASKAAAVPAKPAPGAPAPAVKPAAIPGATSVAAKPAPATSSHNQLQKVNVVPGADGVQIEISSSQAVTPQVTKLTSPDRLLVELPETVVATAQNKIPVGSAGVKGVRIGMDGKTPPTTSVVVDLNAPLAYELTPGAAGKLILTLHSQDGTPSVAKNGPAPAVKAPAPAAKASGPAVQASTKAAPAPAKVAVAKAPAAKPAVAAAKPDPKQVAKAAPAQKVAAPAPAPTVAEPAATAAKGTNNSKQPKPEEKKWAMNGKRDPFFSPVVQTNGSGCSTGKKCLEIGAINLRGVVKSDAGFIAVVTNNLNKAYFLRENDPVFNGYVVKITGDSVVFQETIQDKLGKSFTREVVKRIFTPAV